MSALALSILLFVIISVLMGAVGFKFWVQPKAALERVVGEVEFGRQEVSHPSLSFRDMLQKIGNVVPQNPTDVTIHHRRLITAGFRGPHALKVFYGAKAILSLTLALLSAGLIFGFEVQSELSLFQILAAFFVGWTLPNFMVSRMASRRQKGLRKGMPNALDMLVICVESGLGLDQALMQVAKELRHAHKEISDEFAILNLEIRAGKRRADALHHLGERTDVDELKKLVSVLVQSDRFGTSISQTLKNFSDFMRVQMRQDAEEKAAKIGVKLVFPIFFFILPSLFVVTVGPMIVRVTRDFLPALLGS